MQLLRPENKDFGTKWFLYDMGLSLAGKGLLTTIMMFPEKICLLDSMFYRICGDTKEVVDKIFEELEKTKPGKGGEIQLTDAIKLLCGKQKVYAYDFEGERYDVGDRFGFVKATIDYALDREDLKEDVQNYIDKLALKK